MDTIINLSNHIHNKIMLNLDTRKNWFTTPHIKDHEEALLKSVTTFTNCFISSKAFTDIALTKNLSLNFFNCIIEISENVPKLLEPIATCVFKNCILYIPPITQTTIRLTRLHRNYDTILNNNTIKPYLYCKQIISTFKNDLSSLQPYKLNGMALHHIDLTETTLPNQKDFFKQLYRSRCFNVSLPAINLNQYNIEGASFEDSDLTLITKLPSNSNLFTNTHFTNCKLPTMDYSNYILNNDMLSSCVFTDDSTLPLDELNNLKFQLSDLKWIPEKYLDVAVDTLLNDNIDKFLLEHGDRLDIYHKHILAIRDNHNS